MDANRESLGPAWGFAQGPAVPGARAPTITRSLPMTIDKRDLHRAQAASRAAEPPSDSEGTLDAAEHGDNLSRRRSPGCPIADSVGA